MDSTIEAALITAGISLAVLFIQRAFDKRTQEKNDASHEKDMQALSNYHKDELYAMREANRVSAMPFFSCTVQDACYNEGRTHFSVIIENIGSNSSFETEYAINDGEYIEAYHILDQAHNGLREAKSDIFNNPLIRVDEKRTIEFDVPDYGEKCGSMEYAGDATVNLRLRYYDMLMNRYVQYIKITYNRVKERIPMENGNIQVKVFMPELDKENEKDEKKEKNLIDYADINKIKEHLIQRRTKQFNGKSETESTQDGDTETELSENEHVRNCKLIEMLKMITRHLTRGDKIFLIVCFIAVALVLLLMIMNKISFKLPDIVSVVMIIIILGCAITMVFISGHGVIADSSGYLIAIKADFNYDDIWDMANFLQKNVGIRTEGNIVDLITIQESRKANVESYRKGKVELMVSMISGVTAIASVAKLAKLGLKTGNLIIIIIAFVLAFGSFIAYIFKKYTLANDWSDRNEEALELIRLVKLNAKKLGFN